MSEIQFTPDRTAYIRSHAWMAALAMAAGMVILWAMGNPHVWTGAIGGLGAIILRGWYLMSEEMAVVWTLADTSLTGPAERNIPLAQIERVRTMGSYVQVVTKSGDKHLIKYQADPTETANRIKGRQP
ncbi:hypothetical protein FEE96_02255 [Parasedimentitalea maritima]|uniref:PH domain-containing protein n=1 Tax=Parasedimentitalea maritima TaxID=2578117 RepID=A0A5R8ZUM6_9RHOB|nr:hypothetical protein [Zongyanglinia marina]KAE9632622.1 hypothetical protein GP644_02285 [Zongyanglinia marina]TLP69130.1 hypothetical protein FEE96_02255 [Zongyanglinia marina]